MAVCWHIYPMPGGRGWRFRYEPNVLKQIEERKSLVPIEDAKSRVLSEVHSYFTGPAFKVSAWPASAKQVAESVSLQLVLCEDEGLAKAVCAYADDTSPQEPMPRRFQNAILALAPSQSAFSGAVDKAQRLIAAERIWQEYRTGEEGKLVRDQLQRIRPELLKQFHLQACQAFDRVVFAGGTVHPLEFQVSEEEILQRPQGQRCIRRFLEQKNLIYRAGDALDVNRFLKDVLPGATPCADTPEVYTTKAIHERFLSALKLRLIPDGAVVRQTLLKALNEGKLVIRLADGSAYDAQGCVEGMRGMRHRTSRTLTALPLDDTVSVTRAGTATAEEWLKESEPGKNGGDEKKGGITKPPPPTRIQATSWEALLEHAANRPLLKLDLIANSPAAAGKLASLAQPLGADSLTFTVKVSGRLKGGGTANFIVSGVSLNHPTKPLDIARTLFAAAAEGGTFEADLELDFGDEGRLGLVEQLHRLREEAPVDVHPRAKLDKPVGGAK